MILSWVISTHHPYEFGHFRAGWNFLLRHDEISKDTELSSIAAIFEI